MQNWRTARPTSPKTSNYSPNMRAARGLLPGPNDCRKTPCRTRSLSLTPNLILSYSLSHASPVIIPMYFCDQTILGSIKSHCESLVHEATEFDDGCNSAGIVHTQHCCLPEPRRQYMPHQGIGEEISMQFTRAACKSRVLITNHEEISMQLESQMHFRGSHPICQEQQIR